jgi:hypothetical protein
MLGMSSSQLTHIFQGVGIPPTRKKGVLMFSQNSLAGLVIGVMSHQLSVGCVGNL